MKRCYNTMKQVYVYLHKCKSFPRRNYSRRAAAVTLCVLRCYGASAMGLLNGCLTIITSLSDWLAVLCYQIGLFTNAVHCDIGCLWHVHMIPHPAIPSSLHKPKKPSPCITFEQEKNVAKKQPLPSSRTWHHHGVTWQACTQTSDNGKQSNETLIGSKTKVTPPHLIQLKYSSDPDNLISSEC